MLLSIKTTRALLYKPVVRALALFLACYLLAHTYCTHAFWRNPHSHFYDPSHAYDLQYSATRVAQANTYIKAASSPGVALKKAGEKPEICAAFVTVQREKRNYIDEAQGSMLEGLSDEERAKLYTYVLFANTDPSEHDSWKAPWIPNAVDKVGSYNVSDEKMAHLKQLEVDKGFQEKGVFDYLYAMDTCYATGTPYIALFEDDTILADGWLSKTLAALKHISSLSSPGQSFHNWIYLRLFYTETFLTWEMHDFWWRNYRYAFLLAMSTTAVVLFTARGVTSKLKRSLDYGAIAILALVATPAFVDLLFKAGKYSLVPPNGVFIMNYYGCCSQALVFPRAQVPELAAFLREKNAGQTDSLIEDYSETKHLTRLSLAPQVVQHVGVVSSRGSATEVAKSIWAFYFEAQRPEKLREEHERLLRVIGVSELSLESLRADG